MSPTRREILNVAAGSLATRLVSPAAAAGEEPRQRIKAIAIDAFPVFDPRPVFALAEERFPGKGAALSEMWRIRQFDYAWLRILSQRYADFWQVTEDALVFSAKALKLEMSGENRDRLMQAYLELKPWPDAAAALKLLKDAGFRMALLSNFTPRMLDADVKTSRLEGMFEHLLSTDAIRTYKPDPRAYQMAVDAFGLQREEILFVAFGGWDAAGAKSFGYRTYWVNRQNLPVEELGTSPDGIGATLSHLITFLQT